MKLTKIAGMGVLAAALIAASLGVTGVAAAQEPAQVPTGDGVLSEYEDAIHAALADALGLSLAEFEARIDSGMTLSQIALEQGVAWDDITAVMATARAEVIAGLVADGIITQAQADWFLSRSAGMAGMNGYGKGSSYGSGGAYSYGDGDGDGICDYTGQPVLQSFGVNGGRASGRMAGGRWGGGR